MDKACFAMGNNNCKAIKVKNCQRESFSFYKTKDQLEESRITTRNRLSRLDRLTQQNIADKYYGGKISW